MLSQHLKLCARVADMFFTPNRTFSAATDWALRWDIPSMKKGGHNQTREKVDMEGARKLLESTISFLAK